MKITAGLGCIDDYPEMVEAGVQEVFCGYVPYRWAETYGQIMPLNRREVLYYNVQIGSRSELQILRRMIEVHKVPAAIALNALYFSPEQYPAAADYVKECAGEGFSTFIIADPALLVYLNETGLADQCQIHISGEMSEVNHLMIKECVALGADRMIFHRRNTTKQMTQMIQKSRVTYPDLEFEAFFLNERCHFHGAFCNSLHCDELQHLCRLPYRFQALSKNGKKQETALLEVVQDMERYAFDNISGSSGCGFCALWQLREAGVQYLKIVGRGNYSEDMMRDIQMTRKALHILEHSSSEEEYLYHMKQEIFGTDKTGQICCSKECYY